MSMYGRGLLEATAGRTDTWLLRYDDGTAEPLMLGRWCGSLVAGDRGLLDRCAGPTPDVSCGPGRLAAAVAWRGMPVLGVDISRAAVGMARARGVSALRRSVFDGLPGEERWQTALLVDGNVGIGGDPVWLLSRLRADRPRRDSRLDRRAAASAVPVGDAPGIGRAATPAGQQVGGVGPGHQDGARSRVPARGQRSALAVRPPGAPAARGGAADRLC